MSSSPKIRFAILSDIDALEGLSIQAGCDIDELQWRKYIRRYHTFKTMVIACGKYIDAVCVVRTMETALYIEYLLAHADFGETLAASMFFQQICGGLADGMRLVLQVDEYDLEWQIFLRERDFKCMQTLRGIGPSGGDVLVFEFGMDLVQEYAAKS